MLSLSGDRWDGVTSHEWRVDEPTEREVEAALARLDATAHTLITIERGAEHHLTVGGGAGRYVVYVALPNDRFWNLVSKRPSQATALLNAGGQEGEYSGWQIVDQSQARSAALVFLSRGELDQEQRWEEQH